MASSNRSAIITKSHKVLKKHFKPVEPPADRTLLEHLLLACCLENSLHEHAEGTLAILTHQFFDWNEVRVSARRELAEAMPDLTDSTEAATRLRGALQSVFETLYSFDMEAMKKQNIGQAVKTLDKHGGTTKFTVSSVAHNWLEQKLCLWHIAGRNSTYKFDGNSPAVALIGIVAKRQPYFGQAGFLDSIFANHAKTELIFNIRPGKVSTKCSLDIGSANRSRYWIVVFIE